MGHDPPPNFQGISVIDDPESGDSGRRSLNLSMVERQRLENENLRQDIGMRKQYANRIFGLIVGWLAAVLLILVGSGLPCGLDLSDAVLLALIGGTTATVLGLFVIVANYIFKHI